MHTYWVGQNVHSGFTEKPKRAFCPTQYIRTFIHTYTDGEMNGNEAQQFQQSGASEGEG